MGGWGSGRYKPEKQRVVKAWHPRWLTRLDGRSPVAIAAKMHLAELHDHLGGDPSPVESRLMQRLAHVDLLAQRHEDRSLSGSPEFNEGEYLALVDRHLRLSQALGLRRRARDVGTLDSYLEGKVAEADADGA